MTTSRSPLFWLIPATLVHQQAYAVEYLTIEQAQKVIFPTATKFEQSFIRLTDEQISQVKKIAKVRQRKSEVQLWKAFAKSKLIGYFIVDEVIGKHEYITYSAGISPDGKVLSIEVLVYRETHGGQIKEDSWRSSFKGKTLSDPFKLDEDVPNISGATLSCRNVLDGVKRLLAIHKIALSNG